VKCTHTCPNSRALENSNNTHEEIRRKKIMELKKLALKFLSLGWKNEWDFGVWNAISENLKEEGMEASNQNSDRIRHIYEYLTPKCVAVSAIDLGTNGIGNCHPFYFFNKINFSFIYIYIYIKSDMYCYFIDADVAFNEIRKIF
jgi:hypothetical protein